jgi:hypothetical protein
MIAMVIGLAAVIVSAPIVAAIVVAVASRREDRAWSLGGPARSQADALARRIVAFDADSIDWPRSKAQAQADAAAAARAQWPRLVTTEDRRAS